MISSISYQSLQDFSGLPAIREALARQDPGILITGLPAFKMASALEQLNTRVLKSQLPKSQSHDIAVASKLMEDLHRFSHTIFKNLSHGVELPWEKYLGEMHEFAAAGQDELRTVHPGEPLSNEWSTLTMILNLNNTKQMLVIFGSALSMFTEGVTLQPQGREIESSFLSLIGSPQTDGWLLYYVRPNEDVFYTRTAGALMTPLSTEEYEARRRVKEIEGLV